MNDLRTTQVWTDQTTEVELCAYHSLHHWFYITIGSLYTAKKDNLFAGLLLSWCRITKKLPSDSSYRESMLTSHIGPQTEMSQRIGDFSGCFGQRFVRPNIKMASRPPEIGLLSSEDLRASAAVAASRPPIGSSSRFDLCRFVRQRYGEKLKLRHKSKQH